MNSSRRSNGRALRPLAFLPFVALTLGGCMRWDPATISPRATVETERPSAVRVTVDDGSRYEIDRPVVRGDSVQAEAGCERMLVSTAGAVGCAPGTAAVALESIESMDVRRVDTGLSLLGVGLTVGALLLVLQAAAPF